jgi:hypothetical protein
MHPSYSKQFQNIEKSVLTAQSAANDIEANARWHVHLKAFSAL